MEEEHHLRVVHLEPVHEAVHVHMPGEEQVPLLEQTGEQTARKRSSSLNIRSQGRTYV